MDNYGRMGEMPNKKFCWWLAILMLLMGVFSTIDVSLIGRVTLSEVIMFASLPFLLVSIGGGFVNRNFIKCLWILGLIAFGVIVSDLINQNYLLFSARSLARPAFGLMFLLFFIQVFRREPLALCFYIVGKVPAGLIKYIRPSDFETTDALDVDSYAGLAFRVIPLITAGALTACIVMYYWKKILVPLELFATGVLIAYIGGPRSSSIIWLLSSALSFWTWYIHRNGARRIRMTYGRVFGIGVICIVALTVVYFAYIYAAPQGLLGEEQRAKLVEQEKTVLGNSPLGLLLAGRTQVFAAILGIMDRPLIGFGSWRHDLTSVYVLDAITMVGTDSRKIEMIISHGSMAGAGHSVLFQCWVENGILVAAGYIMVFVIAIKCLLFFVKNQCVLSAYFMFTVCSFSWAFFFSPPGLFLRHDMGLFMAIFVVFMDKKRPLQHVSALFTRRG